MSQSNAHQNQVIVLFEGYSEVISQSVMLANCTCTLVKGKSTCTIVDTRTAWDGNEIVAELEKHDISTSDITHVVCTHGHSDHIGCNYLFISAEEHIVGRAISNKDEYRSIEDDTVYEIDEGIRIIPTPGHTLDSISLIVENSNLSAKPVAICGDLFEKREDCFHELIWIGAGSDSIDQQRKSRRYISEFAGIIIPGHGPQFEVTDEIIAKLREEGE